VRNELFLAQSDQKHPARILHSIGMMEGNNFKIVCLEIIFVHDLPGDFADGKGKPVPFSSREDRNDEHVAGEILPRLRTDFDGGHRRSLVVQKVILIHQRPDKEIFFVPLWLSMRNR